MNLKITKENLAVGILVHRDHHFGEMFDLMVESRMYIKAWMKAELERMDEDINYVPTLPNAPAYPKCRDDYFLSVIDALDGLEEIGGLDEVKTIMLTGDDCATYLFGQWPGREEFERQLEQYRTMLRSLPHGGRLYESDEDEDNE